MSYLKTIEYKLIPTKSFTIIRNCSGCGQKSHFTNTGKFRINANGSLLDVWLIYQCEKCRHTLNLTVYERKKNTGIPSGEYRRFLANDEQLAKEYGTNLPLFQKNKAEIDYQDISYTLVKLQETMTEAVCAPQTLIVIQNPCHLKVRPEKLTAEILGLSASQVKKLAARGTIAFETSAQSVRVSVLEDLS